MADFKIHNRDSAPEGAKPLLDGAQKKFGFVPNLVGMMAESPLTLKGYFTLAQMLSESSAFTPAEQQIIWLTISRENECHYCVAAHSTGAAAAKVEDETIAAIRDEKPLSDPRLEALHRFVSAMVAKRGWLDDATLEDFLKAGFEKSHVLEVILFVAHKTISNYANHLAETPVDEAFQPRVWKQAS